MKWLYVLCLKPSETLQEHKRKHTAAQGSGECISTSRLQFTAMISILTHTSKSIIFAMTTTPLNHCELMLLFRSYIVRIPYIERCFFESKLSPSGRFVLAVFSHDVDDTRSFVQANAPESRKGIYLDVHVCQLSPDPYQCDFSTQPVYPLKESLEMINKFQNSSFISQLLSSQNVVGVTAGFHWNNLHCKWSIQAGFIVFVLHVDLTPWGEEPIPSSWLDYPVFLERACFDFGSARWDGDPVHFHYHPKAFGGISIGCGENTATLGGFVQVSNQNQTNVPYVLTNRNLFIDSCTQQKQQMDDVTQPSLPDLKRNDPPPVSQTSQLHHLGKLESELSACSSQSIVIQDISPLEVGVDVGIIKLTEERKPEFGRHICLKYPLVDFKFDSSICSFAEIMMTTNVDSATTTIVKIGRSTGQTMGSFLSGSPIHVVKRFPLMSFPNWEQENDPNSLTPSSTVTEDSFSADSNSNHCAVTTNGSLSFHSSSSSFKPSICTQSSCFCRTRTRMLKNQYLVSNPSSAFCQPGDYGALCFVLSTNVLGNSEDAISSIQGSFRLWGHLIGQLHLGTLRCAVVTPIDAVLSHLKKVMSLEDIQISP